VSDRLAREGRLGYAGCFGCGIDNPHGLQLPMFPDGDGVRARWTAPAHLGGWPGVLHGGISATVLDEVMAWVPYSRTGRPTVTGELRVKYRRSVPVGVPLELDAWATDEPSGRRWRVAGRILLPDGKLGCEATGLYLEVEPPSD